MSIHKNSREQARLQHISVNFTGGLERALRALKTSPRYYAAVTRIKDVVQFSIKTLSLIQSQYVRSAQKPLDFWAFSHFGALKERCPATLYL